jgi:cytochrome o ubiquinol oxidase subunit 2
MSDSQVSFFSPKTPESFAAAAISLGGGLLDPQGPVAAGNAKILLNATAIMLMIVVPTILTTLAYAWWFRSSNVRARYLPDWEFSGRIEMIVWGIPLLVVLFLSGVIWIGSHELDPSRPIDSEAKALEVQVVSLDWKWLFIYPQEGVASVNELVLPAGVPAHFSLTSGTVMNMFFVPQLGSMIATMNGMVTQLNLKADRSGEFYGVSAQYSGSGFSDMNFRVRSLAPSDFTQWAQETRVAAKKLDEGVYLSLLGDRATAPVSTFGTVSPGLFDKITNQNMDRWARPKQHGETEQGAQR